MSQTGTSTGVAYPPERHFLRDLDSSSWQVAEDRNLMVAPLTDGYRSVGGTAALGFLTALVDIAAAPVALIAGAPDWTATQHLAVHATGWVREGPVVVDARLERAGQNVVVVSVDVYDGGGRHDLKALGSAIDGDAGTAAPADRGTAEAPGGPGGPGGGVRRVGTGLLTFARIPRSASAASGSFDPSQMVGQERSMPPLAPPEGTMLERLGVRVVDADAGVVEIEHSDYVRNSFGTINGGVLGAVAQAAAEASRPELAATDLQIHYLRQTKVGPARTAVTVSRDAADHSVVTARVVDAGDADQLLALATVTLQRPPG